MKKIGRIIKYNGIFGRIAEAEENDFVDFSKKDVRNQPVQVGDIVIYRKEEREPNLKLARYVKVYSSKNH